MPDTETATQDVTSGAYSRLTPEAVARAEALANTDEERAARMGISRRTFYRLLNGRHDIRLSIAESVAEVLDMTVSAAFGKPAQ